MLWSDIYEPFHALLIEEGRSYFGPYLAKSSLNNPPMSFFKIGFPTKR